MKMKSKHVILLLLIAYIGFIFYMAVLGREPSTNRIVRLALFKGFFRQGAYGFKDSYLNFICFIPIGIMAAILFKRFKVVKAFFLGAFVSLTIEFSQLYLRRGMFDVNDLFTNGVGGL